MSVRGGRGPRDPMGTPTPAPVRRSSAYSRSGRYGRGPGDQRRYERYGDGHGGLLGIVLLSGLAVTAFGSLVLALLALYLLLVQVFGVSVEVHPFGPR